MAQIARVEPQTMEQKLKGKCNKHICQDNIFCRSRVALLPRCMEKGKESKEVKTPAKLIVHRRTLELVAFIRVIMKRITNPI